MKKINYLLFFGALALIFAISSTVTAISVDTRTPETKVNNEINSNKEIVYSKNKTIQQLVVSLKGKSQDYINQYLNGEDNQRIVAFPGGGFGMSSDVNNPGIIGTVTNGETGKIIVMDSRSEDSATIGEVKEVLNSIK